MGAAGGLSTSLRKRIFRELADLRYVRKEWAAGNTYMGNADPEQDPGKNPFAYFTGYPEERLKMEAKTATVPLVDDCYVIGKVNGNEVPEHILISTSRAPSAVSLSFAGKYGLTVAPTKFVTIDKRLHADPSRTYSACIENLNIGEASLLNVPVTVLDDDFFRRAGYRGGIILGLTELMLFDTVKFDYPGRKLVLIGKGTPKEDRPNFALLDFQPLIQYQIGNEKITGLIDTGAPFSYIFQSKRWDPDKEEVSRTINAGSGEDRVTFRLHEFPLSFPPCLEGRFELQILPKQERINRFQPESLLAPDIWSDKVLVIDFLNRILCFE